MTVAYLGVVPARAGSVELPRKNVLPLNGKPLVQHTIEAALASTRLSRVVVSSDDPEVLDIAARAGCGAPFVRPSSLAGATSPLVDVALHAIDWFGNRESLDVTHVTLLQPTCPFRTSHDIDAAIDLFERLGVETLASVSPLAQHPCEAVRVDNGLLSWAVPPPQIGGRQSFPDYVFINGAIYIARTTYLRRWRRLVDERSGLYHMPKSHGLDINDRDDFDCARGLASIAQSAH